MQEQRYATWFAALGLLLTGASVLASYFQYRAADLQARAAIAALQPQLQVRTVGERDATGRYVERALEITSDGGPIYNFDSQRLTWFEVLAAQTSIDVHPLDGYWSSIHRTGRTKGSVETLHGQRNHANYHTLADQLAKQIGPKAALSPPISLLRLTYVDEFSTPLVEYFRVSGDIVTRLSTKDGAELWRTMGERLAQRLPVSVAATGDDAFNRWAQEIRRKLEPASVR